MQDVAALPCDATPGSNGVNYFEDSRRWSSLLAKGRTTGVERYASTGADIRIVEDGDLEAVRIRQSESVGFPFQFRGALIQLDPF